jgi:hypothetical protein
MRQEETEAHLGVISTFEGSGREDKTRGWNCFQSMIPGIMSCDESWSGGTTWKGSV